MKLASYKNTETNGDRGETAFVSASLSMVVCFAVINVSKVMGVADFRLCAFLSHTTYYATIFSPLQFLPPHTALTKISVLLFH